MGCKIFPCVDIRGGQARLCLIRRPFLPIRPLTRPLVSRWLIEVPVELHCGVVTFGVVGLSLPLVFVKLMGTWVPSTLFLRCFGGIKFMAKISLSENFILIWFCLILESIVILEPNWILNWFCQVNPEYKICLQGERNVMNQLCPNDLA